MEKLARKTHILSYGPEVAIPATKSVIEQALFYDFLEGTYVIHGIEEVIKPSEAIVIIDPQKEAEDKFNRVLCYLILMGF